MNCIILIGIIIGILIIVLLSIKVITLIGVIILNLFITLSEYLIDRKKKTKKNKKNDKKKELAIEIIAEFEELLATNNIKIPNPDREEKEDEACIYGSDYYNLEESIIEILNR